MRPGLRDSATVMDGRTDPSSHQVLFGVEGPDAGTVTTDGFRFVIQTSDRTAGQPRDLLPRDGSGYATPPIWRWNGWEVPRWYAARNPLFAAMRETFRAIPDAGPPR
jgi:hypothetical protein